MSDAGPGSHDLQRFPPGAAAPTAATRAAEREARLRDPDHLAKMNAGRAEWLAKPKDERDRITAERRTVKEAREAKREAKRAAKRGRSGDAAPDSAPPTARSQHIPATTVPPPPDSDVPRRGAVGGALRGLLDLEQAMSNLGDGVCFIQVERKKPVVAFGQNCGGIQKHLWEPVDDAMFSTMYGGGEYSLRGYKLTDDNRARALTEPVPYRVTGPPNLEAALTEEDTTMRPNGSGGHVTPGMPLRRPQLVTPHGAQAEAEIFDRQMGHEEVMDARQHERRREQEEGRRSREREARQEQTSIARILAESKDKEAERLKEAYERQAESRGGGVTDLVEMMKVMRPGEETAALSRQHSQEIKQIADAHKNEMLRLSEQHRAELQRLTDSQQAVLQRVEDHAREERKRADEAVREADRRSNETIREAQRAADTRVTDAQNQSRIAYDDLKTRGEERVADIGNQWQRRFDDLKEAHARELRQKDSEITLMRQNLEGNQGVILATKDAEIKRLQHDLRGAKDEAEKNKDWAAQAEKFEQQAERMGFQKGGGEGEEEDFKTTIAKAAIGQIHKIPDMIKSGADAIAAIRNPGVPPDVARSQARAGMTRDSMRTLPRTMRGPNPVQLQAPLVFATEDTDYVPPPGEMPAMPRFPPQQPAFFDPMPPQQQQQPPPGYYQQQPGQPAELPPAGPVAPEQAPPPASASAPTTAPAAESQPPAAAGTPAVPTAPPPAAGDIHPMAVTAISGWAPQLTAAFNQSAPPEAVAQAILAENPMPPEMLRSAFGTITIDQVILYITQNPGENGVLATRNGQKFLRAIWNHIDKTILQS